MSWNYRIVRSHHNGEPYYVLREVHYDDHGNPTSMTTDGATFACDEDEGPEGIEASLRLALTDATCRPVLDDPWPSA